MEIEKYGLVIKGTDTPLGFDMQRGGEEFCTDIEIQLETNTINVWTVDTFEEAEKVKNTNPNWYNADYMTPKHPYKNPELEVVKIRMIVERVDQ